jgi:hypothetical protein
MIRSNEVKCPTCKGNVAMRVNRNGFLQKQVAWRFGFYPWKCGACGTVFLYRKRGRRPAPDEEVSESQAAAQRHGRA